MEFEIRAAKGSPYGNKIGLYIFGKNSFGTVLMQTINPEEEIQLIDPAVSINTTQAQVLMDSLWDCGIRPSEGTGSAGQLAATEKHLKHVTDILDKALPVALRID